MIAKNRMFVFMFVVTPLGVGCLSQHETLLIINAFSKFKGFMPKGYARGASLRTLRQLHHLIKISGSRALNGREETLFERAALRHDRVNLGLVLPEMIDEPVQLGMILHAHLDVAVLQRQLGKSRPQILSSRFRQW
jgi:hypothetical protein